MENLNARGAATRRIIATLLLLSLSLSLNLVSFAADTGDAAPVVTVVATGVKNGQNQYLEVGVSINSSTNTDFHSLGLVLGYNKSLLTPVKWSEDTDKKPIPIVLAETNSWQSSIPVDSKGVDYLNGKTALGYNTSGSNPAYLYLGAEAPKKMAMRQALETPKAGVRSASITGNDSTTSWDVLAETETATEQAVVVRFLVEGTEDKDEEQVKTLVQNAVKTIFVDKTTVADTSPAGVAGLAYFGTGTPEVKYLFIEKGITAYSGGGGADLSNLAPVVFYDWDETTILGSIVVDKTDPVAAQKQIDEFTANLYPAGYDQSIPVEDRKYDQASPLTNKKGYSFGKWIEYDGVDDNGEKVYTIYGEAISLASAARREIIPEPKGINFANLSKGYLTLKAAFVSNKEISQKMFYTTEVDSYNRFGTVSNYSIKIKVSRENGGGVHRCRDTALKVTMKTTAGDIYSLVDLQNVDEQVVEIAVPSTITSVQAMVVDIGSITNWVNGTPNRAVVYSDKPGTTVGQDGFMFKGNQAYINEQLRVDGVVDAAHYTTAGLNVSAGNVFGTSATGGNALRTQAQANMKKAYNDKNINGTAVGLTWQEMADAIKSGTSPGPVENKQGRN